MAIDFDFSNSADPDKSFAIRTEALKLVPEEGLSGNAETLDKLWDIAGGDGFNANFSGDKVTITYPAPAFISDT